MLEQSNVNFCLSIPDLPDKPHILSERIRPPGQGYSTGKDILRHFCLQLAGMMGLLLIDGASSI